jgi:hypothetical protein
MVVLPAQFSLSTFSNIEFLHDYEYSIHHHPVSILIQTASLDIHRLMTASLGSISWMGS